MGDGPAGEQVLRRLRGLGVRLAIDDFGTGHSSLARLRELAPDVLKVDRSFVARLDRDAGSRAVVRAVASIARDLGLGVTAEGVESAGQAALLRRLGVPRGQGFYFAPPADAAAVGRLLAGGARLPEDHESPLVGAGSGEPSTCSGCARS